MVKLTPDIVFTSGSITLALRELTGGELTVTVLQEKYCSSDAFIQKYLKCDRVWMRDVILSHQGQSLVWARSCASVQAVQENLQEFTKLGTTPLGDWMFSHDVKLFKRDVNAAVNDAIQNERISVYELLGEKLMVHEQFQL